MLQKLRKRLREVPFLYNAYMRLKRAINPELLGMTSATEQAYLSNYGEDTYSGNGAVVDLGSWLGSTTIPLTEGLLKNPRFTASGRKVYAYDLFVWFDWMNLSVAGTELAGRYHEGDNFVDEFNARIKHVADSVEVCEGDLKEIGWNGQPIEFLLVDAMKGWDLANSIVRDFYPSLIAGQSLVFHQDFAHYFTPWIHLIQWRFRDYFEFVEEIPRSSSIVLKCRKAIPAKLANENRDFHTFDDEDVDAAFEYSMGLVSAKKQPNVAAAKTMWYLHQNKIKEADRVYSELVNKGVQQSDDMNIVKELIMAAK